MMVFIMNNKNFMMRTYAGVMFQQERKTGMINITPLFENMPQLIEFIGGKVNTEISGLTKSGENKRLDNYMARPETKELLTRLAEVEGLTDKEVKRTSRAKDAVGTLVHPVVFVDAMSYISVDFKIWANKLVADELLKFRELSAQSNKIIAKAFDEAGFIKKPGFDYGKINIAIGDACEAPFTQKSATSREYHWNEVSKEQLDHRHEIQATVTNFGQGIAAIKGLAKRF